MDMLQELRAAQARYESGLQEQARNQGISTAALIKLEKTWGANGNSSSVACAAGTESSGKTDAHFNYGYDDEYMIRLQYL